MHRSHNKFASAMNNDKNKCSRKKEDGTSKGREITPSKLDNSLDAKIALRSKKNILQDQSAVLKDISNSPKNDLHTLSKQDRRTIFTKTEAIDILSQMNKKSGPEVIDKWIETSKIPIKNCLSMNEILQKRAKGERVNPE